MAAVITIPELRGLGQAVPFFPARMVRVTTGKLHHAHAELAKQPLELGNARDLEAPATNAQAQGGQG